MRAAMVLWRIAKSTDGAAILNDTINPDAFSQMAAGCSDFRMKWALVLGLFFDVEVSTLKRLSKFVDPEIREPDLAALTKIEPPAALESHTRAKSEKSNELISAATLNGFQQKLRQICPSRFRQQQPA